MERLHDAPFATFSTSPLGVEEASLLSRDNDDAAAAMLVSPVDDDAILRATLTQQKEQPRNQPSTSTQNSFANPSFRFFPNTSVDFNGRSGERNPHARATAAKDLPLLTPDESGSWANFRFLGLDPNENNDDDGSAQLLVSPPSPIQPTTSPPPPPSPPVQTTTSRFKKMPSPGSGGGVVGTVVGSASSKKRRTYNKLDISSTMGVPLLAEQMDENGEEEEDEEGLFGGESEDTESVGMTTKENSLADLNVGSGVASPPPNTNNDAKLTSPSRFIDNLKSTLTAATTNGTTNTTTTGEAPDTTTTAKSSFLSFYANLESKTSNVNNSDAGDADVVENAAPGDDEEADDDNGSARKKHFSSLNNLLDENGMGQEEVEGMVVEDEDLDDEEEKPEMNDYVEVLPTGWERHESDDGPYYWHIKSGTIQLEAPEGTVRRPMSPASVAERVAEKNLLNKEKKGKAAFTIDGAEDDAATAGQEHLREFEDHALKFASESLKHLELEHKKAAMEGGNGVTAGEIGVQISGGSPTPSVEPRRFSVKSLGWLKVEESDLTPERSSKAVNRCIVELSNPGGSRLSGGGRGAPGVIPRSSLASDSIGGWGEGKGLSMEISEDHLVLIDAANTVLTKLSIQSIRVWGVGRDNEHDFAYVAREKTAARQYLCHVFRCEVPARAIANALRDACRRLMAERQKMQSLKQRELVEKANSIAAAAAANADPKRPPATRPGSLPMPYRNGPSSLGVEVDDDGADQPPHHGGPLSLTSFPTPMEEPRKSIKAEYLGSVQVPKPMGMEMLTPAIEKLSTRVPKDRWQKVDVVVAPSTVQVIVAESRFGQSAGETLAECRVRYLSFMGIGKDVQFFAFINHTPEDTFVCHVFFAEPSAAALCKTIEAACKLRFQKCLDGEMRRRESPSSSTSSYSLLSPIGGGGSGRSGLGSSLKEGVRSVFSNLSQKLKTPQ